MRECAKQQHHTDLDSLDIEYFIRVCRWIKVIYIDFVLVNTISMVRYFHLMWKKCVWLTLQYKKA